MINNKTFKERFGFSFFLQNGFLEYTYIYIAIEFDWFVLLTNHMCSLISKCIVTALSNAHFILVRLIK